MESVKIKGIVVNSANMGDNDKMLNVLTAERGVISVSARGVKSLKNKNSQAVSPLCYSHFVLKEKGDIYSLVSADLEESFYSLREDVTALSYAVYFAQLAAYIVGRDNECTEELRLLLNSLYVLSKNPQRASVLCCAYEVKMCELGGFAPYIGSCSCGADGIYFDIPLGECVCNLHKTEYSRRISENAKKVIEYVLNAELKEALSFDTPMGVSKEVSNLTEAFLTHHLGKLPRSLDYIKKVIY